MPKATIPFTIFLIALPSFVFAQKQDYMWPLGLGPGWSDVNFFLNFSTDPPSIALRSDSTSYGLYSSSFCDSAGNVVASSNGVRILDRYGELMENGRYPNPTLGGYWNNDKASYPGEQSGFFLAKPNNDSVIYFISLDFDYHPRGKWPFLYTGGRLLAATIDMRANEGRGKVVNKHEVLVKGHLASPAATRHANGRDWWILTADADSNRYFRVLLSPQGFSKAEVQLIGSKPDYLASGKGSYIVGNTFSPSGKLYIDQNPYIGFSVFNFDRCSGLLSNERRRDYPAPLPPFYVSQLSGGSGAVFSADDRLLYMTHSWFLLAGTIPNGSKPYLLQYDLKAENWRGSADTLNLVAPNDSFFFVFQDFLGAEQGPDGRIYIVHRGDSYCTVQYPNRRGKGAKFLYNVPDFKSTISTAIPYMPNYRLGPLNGSPCDTLGINNVPVAHFRTDDSLNHLTRYFYDLSHHEPAEWHWDFGDGTASADTNALHIFAQPGIYNVCLTVKNANGSHTTCRKVEIKSSVSTGGEPAQEEVVKVYPNPAAEQITVQRYFSYGVSGEPLRFVLTNAVGQVVANKNLLASTSISVVNLPDGLYFWQVMSEGEVVKSGKVVKQR
jgi:hypothetical protein